MRRTLRAIAGAALALAMLSGAATAGGPRPDSVIGKLYLSRLLIDHAEASNDPLALITAARIRAQAESAVNLESMGDDGATPFAPQALLERAGRMARADSALSALIESERSGLARSSGGMMRLEFDGPRNEVRKIRARATDRIDDVAIPANAYAEVYVEGDGRANLDLIIETENGVIICSDTDPSSINFCGWQNDASQLFTIEVLNRDGVASQYSLFIQS